MLASKLKTKEQRQKQIQLMKEAQEMGSFSGDKLFNKWNKERLMQTIITKDTFKEVPNERYFQVSLLLELTVYPDNCRDSQA